MSCKIVHEKYLKAIERDSKENILTSEDIFLMFTEFLIEFERMETSEKSTQTVFYDAIEEIIDAVLSIRPYKLLETKLLHHPLMYFLQQFFMSLLNKWRQSPLRITIQQIDSYLKVILIFIHIAEQVSLDNTGENQIRQKNIVVIKQFLFKVREQMDEIILNRLSLNDDRNIYALGLVTINLLEDYPFFYELGNNERLVRDLVINSLDSYDFNQVINQLESGRSLTDIEYYLLEVCWQNLCPTSSSNRIGSIDLIYNLADEFLTRLEFAFAQPPPLTSTLFNYMFERFYQLLIIRNLPTFDKHVDQIIQCLVQILRNSSTEDRDLFLVTLKAFQKLINENRICSIVKTNHLTSFFNQYTSTNKETEEYELISQILTQIMEEQDVEENPLEIMKIIITELQQLAQQTYNRNTDKTLSNLKTLIQSESIKSEFLKQNGLDILVDFIRNAQFNDQSSKQFENALNILWSCTFNNTEVITKLQQDVNLLTRVNQILENAKQEKNNSLERAAEGFIWKVEKEEEFKKRKAQENNDDDDDEEQFDCMISYSWDDMTLAHRIFDELTTKFGYKVWLDKEQMHGSTIDAMANAVENAQFILLCMSDSYKRSVNCQSEAEYAFNRKKHIIPIKIKRDFQPDGWLGFIVGSRMYIDFGKYEFDEAMNLLNNEIQLQKKNRKSTKVSARQDDFNEIHIRVDLILPNDYFRTENHVTQIEFSPKDDISTWSNETVEDFLRNNYLIDLLPICQQMNGEELLNLHAMCKQCSILMYRSLKDELLNIHDQILPISTFLHFIHRIDSIAEYHLRTNKH